MSPSADSGLPRQLLGQLIDYAHGRIAYARSACHNSDRTGVLHALHQLKGLCAHTGDATLATSIHALEDRVLASATFEEIAHVLNPGLAGIEQALEALDPHHVAPRRTSLDDIVAAAGAEAHRVARRRHVTLTLPASERTDTTLPWRTAMVVLDAVGHLVRNAVVHGGGSGQVTVMFGIRVDQASGLTWEVLSTGRAASGVRTPDIDSGRGVALDAVAAELARNGGRLEHASLPDGYRAVIHVPAAALHDAIGSAR